MNGARPLTRVVVLGRDADLWLCVLAISRALEPAGVQVVAIELPTRLQPSHVSATLPPLEALHAKLEIEESALMRATGGSFSLGQNFVTAAGRVPAFFHAWGAYGAPVEGNPFFPYWRRATRNGFNVPLQNFSLTAVAAHNGRMLLPDAATSAFGRTDYGYHLQTLPYVGFIKSMSARLGAEIHEARAVIVERESDTGYIAALVVDSSLRVEGQLFVDATGEDAVLIGQSLRVAREQWRKYFSVDRVLSARAPAFTSTPPFAEIRVGPAGWTALHPDRLMTGVLHGFSSHMVSDETAFEAVMAAASAKLVDVSCQQVDPYLRSKVWEGNCIAVGGAACALDPVHDVELHVLQLGLVHLLSLFPVSDAFAAERAEYNRLSRSCYERVRDFQCAFYSLAPYVGPFWQQLRPRAMPPPLEHKIATFKARALIAPLEDETFSPESWQALFTGLGVVPEDWPPVVDRIAPHRLQEQLRQMLGFIKGKVTEQPAHDRYLESLCGSLS
jgi:tryptophan 7-halogenase